MEHIDHWNYYKILNSKAKFEFRLLFDSSALQDWSANKQNGRWKCMLKKKRKKKGETAESCDLVVRDIKKTNRQTQQTLWSWRYFLLEALERPSLILKHSFFFFFYKALIHVWILFHFINFHYYCCILFVKHIVKKKRYINKVYYYQQACLGSVKERN